jgi:ABC-type transport system involved in multi-copper enzyme maturation permease subunit
MSFNKIGVIGLFELQRLFATGRGLLLLLVMSIVWGWIQYKVVSQEPATIDLSLNSFFRIIGLSDISLWPSAGLAVHWGVGVYLLPFISVLFAVDIMATDIEKGTLKFWRLRASTNELVVGRILGKLASIFAVIFVTTLLISIYAVLNDANTLDGIILKFPFVIVILTLMSAPFIAAMTMFSLVSKTPRKALILYTIFYVVVSMVAAMVEWNSPNMHYVRYLLPGYGLSSFSGLSDWPNASLMLTPFLQSIFYMLCSALIAKRVSL